MTKSVVDINWRYYGDTVLAFITIAVMPFTYRIAYGLIAGIITSMGLNTTVWIIEKLSGGRIKPANEEDPWTYTIPGSLRPWAVRAARGKKDFWHEDEESIGVDADRASESSSGGRMTERKSACRCSLEKRQPFECAVCML